MKSASTFKNLVLIVFAILISCTDSTDDLQDIYLEDFLQKNDGTEWLLSNDDLEVYIRLNDNLEHLIEQWRYLEEQDCFEYNPNIFYPGTAKIVVNHASELTVEGDPVLSDYEQMTLIREGNNLKVILTINEWQQETVYFSQSTRQIEILETCSEQNDSKIYWVR